HATGTRSRNLVFVHGNTTLYGDPRPFINDPHGGKVSRSVAELNAWLWDRHWWFMTPGAMKVLAGALAFLLLALAVAALPVRRGQAAAPWSSGSLSRREFDALYRDVAELCRTLGSPLIEAAPDEA